MKDMVKRLLEEEGVSNSQKLNILYKWFFDVYMDEAKYEFGDRTVIQIAIEKLKNEM